MRLYRKLLFTNIILFITDIKLKYEFVFFIKREQNTIVFLLMINIQDSSRNKT